MTTKLLAENFLNKELDDLAKSKSADKLPQQSTVKAVDVDKVQVKNVIIYAPIRPQ